MHPVQNIGAPPQHPHDEKIPPATNPVSAIAASSSFSVGMVSVLDVPVTVSIAAAG